LHHVVRLIHEADHPPPGQLLSVKAKLKLLLLLRDAARGLHALHAQHTVHGDLVSYCGPVLVLLYLYEVLVVCLAVVHIASLQALHTMHTSSTVCMEIW
jgi:hypothetical protein